MKAAEDLKKFRAMKREELAKELSELEKRSVLLALKIKSGKEKNYSKIAKNRRELAQVATLIREKELNND